MRIEFEARVRVELPKPPRTEPFPSPQVFRPILCPYCGSSRVKSRTVKRDVRWYECLACSLDGSSKGTAFRVPVRPGDEALIRLAEGGPS